MLVLNKGLYKFFEKNLFIFMVFYVCEWCSLEFEECIFFYFEIIFGFLGRVFFLYIGYFFLGYGLAYWLIRKLYISFNDGFGLNGGFLEIEKLLLLMFYFLLLDICICFLNLNKSYVYWKIGLIDNKWVWKF